MKINRIAAALPLLLSGGLFAATYQVVEIPTESLGPLASSRAIDAQGTVGIDVSASFSGDILVRPLFNLPIDLSLLDFESESLNDALTDPDAAEQGDFNANDLLVLSLVVGSPDLRTSLVTQKLSYQESFLYQNGFLEPARAFDVFSEELDSFTRSIDTSIARFNSQGDYVGTSQDAYYKLIYLDENDDEITYILNDFSTLGYAQVNDRAVPLFPTADTLGGRSRAFDINSQLQVVGEGSTEFTEAYLDTVADCDDEELRGDQPIEACQQSRRNSLAGSARMQGMLWQLDANGNIVDTTALGILFEPEEDDTAFYTSAARAINDSGLIVGDSHILIEDNGTLLRTHAAVFENDDVIGFIDTDEYLSSSAVDVNDDNLVVGNATRVINGATRSKFYVYDHDTREVVFPDDFFVGSSSFARAINSSYQVVGTGEVDSTISSTRRREAFLYDHNNATFTNLNDLIACDSPYNLFEANDINDDGEIAANAVIAKARRDSLGDIELDPDTGEQIIEDTVVAVKLVPINGEVEDCSAQEPTLERSAGNISYLLLLPLIIFGMRRGRVF